MAPRSVLVVEHDDDERARIGRLLEREGFDVVLCPGPAAPDYVCAGGRGLPCPIAKDADVVALDMRLAGDVMMRGTPGWELLIYYMERGKRIVAMSNGEDTVHPLSDDRVIAIKRPADEATLLAAIRELFRRLPTKEERRHGLHIAR
ncbi:MAG TPA: hypothetical protein VJ818_05795 [Actinomycetota bacterium]|nr:hypothetical protein [Actinomycetota bacterium]